MNTDQPRTIIVGDVHGCFEELQSLMHQVDYQPQTDRLIFVGDLINKGPDSRKVLEWVMSVKAEVILGNHEWEFLKYVEAPSQTQKDFSEVIAQLGDQQEHWVSWIRTWPLFVEDFDFLVVHAGLAPHRHPAQTEPHILLNIRTWDGIGTHLNNPANPPWYELYEESRLVLFGHWATNGLVIRPNVIGLDTGCVYGIVLTAVTLPDRKIYQVPAKHTYATPTPLSP